MRKPSLLFVLLTLLAVLLAACAGAQPEVAPEAEGDTEVVDVEPVSEEEVVEELEEAETSTEAQEAVDEAAEGVEATGEPVTIDWWHISTEEDDAAVWEALANEYVAENPNVDIEITVLENEAFKSRLATAMQAGDPPDLFQSWGGGVLWAYADAGLVRDIAPELEGEWGDSFTTQSALELYGQDGEYYGVPWRWGATGIFVNKDLFEQAGLDPESCPATWSEFLETVQTLKDAGITPIALGESEKWPGHFWWAYLATRLAGEEGFLAAYNREGSFADEPFVEAGERLQELIEMEPFPEGFLGLSYGDEAAIFGNEEAAMELMGQWGPGQAAFMSETGEGVENLGWCPFPMVEGGAGNPEDVLGGGDGFALGVNAPDETVDFLRFLTSVENQRRLVEEAEVVPVVVEGTEDLYTEEWLQTLVAARDNAPYFQLYYDQFLPPAVGEEVNDAVEGLFAGVLTPEQVAQQIEETASFELE